MKKKIIVIIFVMINILLRSQSLGWAKSFGNNLYDYGYALTVDKQGNVYTTGQFSGNVDFDSSPTTYTLNGSPSGFITKMDNSGALLWAKSFAGIAVAICIDSLNNIYLAGQFDGGSGDFDPGPGIFTLSNFNTSAGNFVLKLDSNGNFIWAKNIKTSSHSTNSSISYDPRGYVYVTGNFKGTAECITTTGTSTITSAGDSDILISKLDTTGNYLWIQHIGGSGLDAVTSSVIDPTGNLYITGNYSSIVDFDTGIGTYTVNASGTSDTYILKQDPNGNFIWVKTIGNPPGVNSYAITLGSLNDIYITGSFTGTMDFDPGINSSMLTSSGSRDVFILKMDSSGNYKWAKTFEGPMGVDIGATIFVDAMGKVYSVGRFQSIVDFDPGPAIMNVASMGPTNVYVSTLDSLGNFLQIQTFKGNGIDFVSSMRPDNNGNIFITGHFTGITDFDPSSSVYNLTSNGNSDIFITKLSSNTITAFYEKEKKLNPLNIYPNPNNGSFNIIAKEKMNLNVMDYLGQIIQHIDLNENNQFQQNLNLQVSGIYFIIGQGDHQSVNAKIIVSK